MQKQNDLVWKELDRAREELLTENIHLCTERDNALKELSQLREELSKANAPAEDVEQPWHTHFRMWEPMDEA